MAPGALEKLWLPGYSGKTQKGNQEKKNFLKKL
jgi:hypothetical protein